MTSLEFIENIIKNIDSQIELYTQGKDGSTFLGSMLDDMELSSSQRDKD